jgi:hypothetical protein
MKNLWPYPDDCQHCVKLLNNRETERRMFTVPYLCGEAEFDSFLKIAATERAKRAATSVSQASTRTKGRLVFAASTALSRGAN